MNIKVNCWVRFKRRVRRYEASTESLSRTGMLLRMEGIEEEKQLAAIGDAMEVEVALPSKASGERKVMQCTAIIARIRLDGKGTWWVTGDIRSMKFRDMPQGLEANSPDSRGMVM